jgi:hypothetical protein
MRFLALPISLFVVLCACDKAEPTPEPAPKTEDVKPVEPPAEVAPPVPTIAAPTGLFDCKPAAEGAAPAPKGALPFELESCPKIPSIYGTLAWGMNQDAASQAIKGVKIDGDSGRFKVGKQTVYFGFDEAGKVDQLRFKTSPAGLAAMTAAWGAPLETEFLGDKTQVWFNVADKIKVELEDNTFADAGDDSEKYSVRYRLYTPLSELVGPEGLLSKPIIGTTGEELAQAYPEWLVVKSAEEAKADMDKLGLDAKTAGIAAWAGADQASAKLKLPRPETNNNLTISLEWADDKVKSYRTSLGFGKDQAAKAEMLAVIAAALGAPTSGSVDSQDKWTYNFAGPNGKKLELRDTGESWSFEVSK